MKPLFRVFSGNLVPRSRVDLMRNAFFQDQPTKTKHFLSSIVCETLNDRWDPSETLHLARFLKEKADEILQERRCRTPPEFLKTSRANHTLHCSFWGEERSLWWHWDYRSQKHTIVKKESMSLTTNDRGRSPCATNTEKTKTLAWQVCLHSGKNRLTRVSIKSRSGPLFLRVPRSREPELNELLHMKYCMVAISQRAMFYRVMF